MEGLAMSKAYFILTILLMVKDSACQRATPNSCDKGICTTSSDIVFEVAQVLRGSREKLLELESRFNVFCESHLESCMKNSVPAVFSVNQGNVSESYQAALEELLHTTGDILTTASALHGKVLRWENSMDGLEVILHTRTVRPNQGADLTNLLNGKATVRVIDGQMATGVAGMVSVKNEIFIIQNRRSTIKVYDADSLSEVRTIDVPGMLNPVDIAYYEPSSCLYINDQNSYKVHEIQLNNSDSVSSWNIFQWPCKLFMSVNGTILFVCRNKCIYEFSRDGYLRQRIDLDRSIEYPWYAAQLANGYFAVCHGLNGLLNRVVIVDNNGKIMKAVGSEYGSAPEQFKRPYDVLVSRDWDIMVTDRDNQRIKLYTGELEYRGEVKLPGFSLDTPYRIHLDETKRRLYIAEFWINRFIVVDF